MASSSRVFILLGLMLAIVLLISSEVTAAKDLAAAQTETQKETAETNGVEESKYGGYGGGGYGRGGGGYGRGGGGGRYGGGCRYGYCYGRCCTYAGEAKDAQTTEKETAETNGVEESKYGGYGGYGGRGGYGGGGYGGGRGGYGGGGYGGGRGGYGGGGYGGGRGGYGGGGYGGGCRYGYCYGRCCTYAGEAKDAQTSTEPQN